MCNSDQSSEEHAHIATIVTNGVTMHIISVHLFIDHDNATLQMLKVYRDSEHSFGFMTFSIKSWHYNCCTNDEGQLFL